MGDKIGIYKITNLVNGKVYIGQSIHISTRLYQHKKIRGISHGSLIDKAIQKYGVENFSFEILELCLKNELDEKEKKFIQEYNSITPNGYNIKEGGQGGAIPYKCKPVYKYDYEGNFLCGYPSIEEASRNINCSSKDIYEAIKFPTRMAHGFFWREEKKDRIEIIKPKAGSRGGKTVYQYAFETKEYINSYKSIADASRELGDINYNKNISSCARGQRNVAYNYIWSYLYWDKAPEDYRKINYDFTHKKEEYK